MSAIIAEDDLGGNLIEVFQDAGSGRAWLRVRLLPIDRSHCCRDVATGHTYQRDVL